MLQSLHVKNFAIIDETEVDFREHLNIMTGETGAGKSILIDSVNAAIGAKVSKDIIRRGADYALVELTFGDLNSTTVEALKQRDIYPEEGMLVLSRKIMESGKSVCKINGETVTTAILKEVAGYLIDIHGQQEHHSLLQKSSHLKFLDRFAKEQLGLLPKQLEEAYKNWKAVKEELENAVVDEGERNREMSFLTFAVEEIEAARLRVGEDIELEEEYKILSNSKQIVESVGNCLRFTKEAEDNAEDFISRAQRFLSKVSEYDAELQNLESVLNSVQDMLSDFNGQAADYISNMEDSGERFFEVEQRLNMVNQLKGKYGDTIEAVLAYKEECSQKIEKYNNYETYLEKLRKNYKEAEGVCIDLCMKISSIRKENAIKMTAAMTTALQDLNFSDVQFELPFETMEQFNASGFDSCEFMISLNLGEALKPLTKVASGGELSRIMLAMKSILANQDDVPTLIFDEIDTGISGRTAQMVSEKMAQIGVNHQILCITHLSQIAAMADAHFLIEKSVEDGRTKTEIHELNTDEIYTELARMLGGAEITPAVLQNAKEMKHLANQVKSYS
ncbi:MAG: DNA repair protein RecN [Lachnospiraceae bacterium]|nr:DNA repair protein RecN [Lachnospiraceae bacterium]